MAASNIIPVSSFAAKVGKQYAKDEIGKHGLSPRGIGLDYFSNAAARTGWGTPSLTESTEYDLVRLSYNYPLIYTLYRNHWICRRIVDVPAQDMVRAWPRLTSEIDPKDLGRIDRAIRDTQTKSQMLLALKWARLFGGAGALIVIEGQENILDEPLNLESIEIGAFKGVIPFDRWSGIQPKRNVSTDFRKPREFNLPEAYRVQSPTGGEGFDVHASRILRLSGPMVPAPEYQAQNFWGISVLEPCFEEIRKRDNIEWNAVSLTFRAQLIGMKFPDLAEALSGAGMSLKALQQFQGRMQAVNELMSNQSLMMLPKDGEMSSINYSFTGLAELIQQEQLNIAGASQIPISRLYGRTLTGLGNSNDPDEQIYADFIALEQSDQLEPQLDTLYRVICMSTLGEIPEDLDLKFPSIRVPTEKEKTELSKNTADSVVSVFGAGIINKPQALRELKQSSDVTGIFTNITDAEIEEAERQEQLMPAIAPGESDENEPDQGKAKDAGWEESKHPRD